MKAVQDGIAKKPPAIPADQLRPALAAFEKRQQAKMQEAKAKFDKVAADNQTKSNTFLAANKGVTRAEAIAAWTELKELDVPKNYASWVEVRAKRKGKRRS